MDTATAVLLAKAGMVLVGVVVFLRILVKEYERMGGAMAGEIAEAALARGRTEHSGPSGPRVTLTPASDDQQ